MFLTRPNVLTIGAIALGASLALMLLTACATSVDDGVDGLSCDDIAIPTAERPGVRSRTPGPPAALGEVASLLERYESTSWSAEYRFCYQNLQAEVHGSIHWYKDAGSRARMDVDLSVDGKQASVTGIAVADGGAPRAAVCSADVGNYFRTLGGSLAPAYEGLIEVEGLLALGAACFDADFEDDGVLATADQIGLSPPLLANVRSAPDIYAFDAIVYKLGTDGHAGRCVRLGSSYRLEEYCFRDDGVLTSVATIGESSRSRYELVETTVGEIKDSDFRPPYEVVSSPEECPYETAWEATPGVVARDPMATPTDDLVLEYRDTLVRHFKSSYGARYHLCYRGFESGSFDGSLRWYKDGFVRARYDLQTAAGDRSVSYYAARDDVTYWCSEDLGKEIARQVIGSDREDIPTVQDLLDVKAGCVEDSEDYRSCVCFGLDDDFLGRLFFFDAVTHDVAVVESGAGEGLRIPGLRKETRTIAGLEATCFVRASGEECYGPSGELLLVRTGADTLQAEFVGAPPSGDDFTLPFEVKEGLPQRQE